MQYKKENLTKFKLPKKKTKIGECSYGIVYRISPRRVVKIYDGCNSFENNLQVLNDEINSAKKFKNGLIPLKAVVVKFNRKKHPATIKRYLPLEVTGLEILHLEKHKFDCYDFCQDQYRKDYKGTIYRVDTQLQINEYKSK
jgi:hypothetical protein